MSDVQLGMLAPDDADRDATHVAVVPMIASKEMPPGAHCGPDGDGTAGPGGKLIGVVDPFLQAPVREGQRFFLCLYPRSVTGLRHQYLHPVLDGDTEATSRDWIEKWADAHSIDYHDLMRHAEDWAASTSQWGGDYWTEGGRFEGTYLPKEFWDHYDRVTKTTTPEEKRESFFSCSC
jgi:hypothetical protein